MLDRSHTDENLLSTDPTDTTLEANAYAVAYRMLGDRPAAHAASGIAAERLRSGGGLGRPDWLYSLVGFTIDQTVAPPLDVVPSTEDDEYAGLRSALRRRLARATSDERVAGALVHLAGYPPEFVAGVLGRPVDETISLAGVLAPPPGVDYRDLGDPELIGAHTPSRRASRRSRRPHWTTVIAVAIVLAAVVAATQVTGPRPTLGPPFEEGSSGISSDQPGVGSVDDGVGDDHGDDQVGDHLNGGPLTQATNE